MNSYNYPSNQLQPQFYSPPQEPIAFLAQIDPVPIYTTYENLPNYDSGIDLNQIAEMIKSRFEDRSNWKGQFDAIDNIRVINKYHPSQVNNIFIAFGAYILDHLDNHTRTNIFRNCLFLMKEIFLNCKEARLADEVVQKILPILLSKIISEKQIIKEEIKSIFELISQNCLYDSTFSTMCQLCFDKNVNIAEAALKVLARMITNLGLNLMSLPTPSIRILFKTLGNILDEKKTKLKSANLRTWTVEICTYIYKLVGVENFLNFLNVLLEREEADAIKMAMEKPIIKKESKKSRVSLGDYIKSKRDVVNFNGYCHNNNMN